VRISQLHSGLSWPINDKSTALSHALTIRRLGREVKMTEPRFKNRPGWAVELLGEKGDIEDFREHLAIPFDPWVEDFSTADGPKVVLRSVNWDGLTEAAEVFRRAAQMLNRLNGEALLFYGDVSPLKLGETIKFGAKGEGQRIALLSGSIHGKSRVRAKISTASSTPQKSTMQRWFQEAETDEARAELFATIGRADNWYDLYKSMELAKELANFNIIVAQDAAKDPKDTEAPEHKWCRIRRTANCNRHAEALKKTQKNKKNQKARTSRKAARGGTPYPLPNLPAEFDEGRAFVLNVIRRCFPA
jgi:hypothetical protein